MKRSTCSAAVLATGLFLLSGLMFPVAAQTSVPSEASRPVIPPAKAGPQGAQGPSTTPEAASIEATIAEIMPRPKNFEGKRVTVVSQVDEVFTPWSFKLDEGRPHAGGIDSDLLVIAAEPLVTMGFDPAWKDRKIRVTGTVRILQAADFRREYGRGVDDKLFRRYEGKPGLVATSMKRVD